MRIAIRDLTTKMFFNQGEWTTSAQRAQCFANRKTVERVVFEYNIEKAEMVFMDDAFRLIGGVFIPLPGSPHYQSRTLKGSSSFSIHIGFTGNDASPS
jgi:hypothetical protein